MRRRMTIRAAQFLAIWAMGVSVSFGQAPERGRAPDAEAPAAEAERSAAPPRQAGAPAKPVDPAKMEWLLKQWERQSSLLKTLDVTILRIDDAPAWGDREYYEGRALFKSPNLAFIDFNKIKLDDKKKPIKDPQKNRWVSTPYERIVCTGTEVWQYRSDTQQIFIFPLENNEQKKAIEEGPLPFLFNMRAEDAKQRYQITLMSEDKKSYGISIKPKLKEDKDSFSLAFVNLDHDYLLPIRIVMLSPDGKSNKDFRLGPMYPNRQVNDKNFEGKPLGPPWKIVRNPADEERPRAGMARTRPEGQAEPAAARSRGVGVERQ
jgi:TIGR03009 family protein